MNQLFDAWQARRHARPAPDTRDARDLRRSGFPVLREFSFAEQVLADQRRLAQQWASATVDASTVVTEQAQRATRSVSDRTADAAEAVVDNTAETAPIEAHTVAATHPVNDDAGR